MARRELVRVRPFSVIAALLLVVLSIGVGGSASADPGNGQGAEKSAVAQQDNGSGGKSATSSASLKSQSGTAGTHSTSGTSGTSGDDSLPPQPLSNADTNSGGANGQCADYEGPYCSTRDGSASANGNGGGEATHRPDAAEVGKADNKNPQGQKPNALYDGNNGYECDGNHGIARGNPAHTACQPTLSVSNPPPANVAGVETVRPPANVAGVETVRPPTNVAGVETVRPPAAVPPVAVPPAAVPAGVLPATGAPDLLGLLGGGGMGLLTLGGLTIWLHRRNRVIG